MTQPQNESALALINLTLAAVTDSREMLEHVRDRETGPRVENARSGIEAHLRFAEIYLSALAQKLDAIEQVCGDAVREDSTIEEVYHRVSNLLHAARVNTAAPRGQEELDHAEETED